MADPTPGPPAEDVDRVEHQLAPVHGAGNVADTYEMVRKLAANVAKAMGGHLDPALGVSAESASRTLKEVSM